MATKKQDYGNDSISSLKGADRVRKRPGVIFGSDGLDCRSKDVEKREIYIVEGDSASPTPSTWPGRATAGSSL